MSITDVKRNTALPARPVWTAVRRGMACRCPACGEGQLFRAYLKVNDTCPACGTELYHQRADDFPPYLVIFILGHLLVGIMVHIEMVYTVPASIYLWVLIPMTIILSLVLLPVTKGGVVGLQWAQYMHGFHPEHRITDDA